VPNTLGRLVRGFVAFLAACCALLGVSPAAFAQLDPDWARSALADQYELGSSLALRNAPWVGTHNSFNSRAEMGPTLSAQDSNQQITIVDQLDQGVRSLELDVHWFFSLRGGGFAPVVCHAAELHAGCSVEKPLGVVLREITDWLRDNGDQVLLLYLEDHLDSQAGYDAAAAEVESALGPLLYRPTQAAEGGPCESLPLDTTRAQIRKSGARVMIVSSCGMGTEWPAVAFDWSRSHEEERPRGYRDFPDCGPDFTRAEYDAKLIRYYEDSTRLTATASGIGAATVDDGISVETAAAMTRCGVDLFGLDQVAVDDPRFAALVWSWAPGQPRRRPGCAAQHASRWYPLRCTRRLRVACRTADGRWRVPSRLGTHAQAPAVCKRRRSTWAVPRTGFEAQELQRAMNRVRASRVWLRAHVDS
jgi:hypothetical protein